MLLYVLTQGNPSVTPPHRSVTSQASHCLDPFSHRGVLPACRVPPVSPLLLPMVGAGPRRPPRDGVFHLDPFPVLILAYKRSHHSPISVLCPRGRLNPCRYEWLLLLLCGRCLSKAQHWDELGVWGGHASRCLSRKLQPTAGRGTEGVLNEQDLCNHLLYVQIILGQLWHFCALANMAVQLGYQPAPPSRCRVHCLLVGWLRSRCVPAACGQNCYDVGKLWAEQQSSDILQAAGSLVLHSFLVSAYVIFLFSPFFLFCFYFTSQGHDDAVPCAVLKSVDSFSFLHHPVHQRSLEILQRCKEEKYSKAPIPPFSLMPHSHGGNGDQVHSAQEGWNHPAALWAILLAAKRCLDPIWNQ